MRPFSVIFKHRELLALETTTPKLLIFCTTFYETLLHLFFANRWSLKNYAKLFEFHFVVCQMYLCSFGSPWIRNNYMAKIKSWIFQCFGLWFFFLFFASNREEYLATKMQWKKIHNNPLKMLTLKSCENKGHLPRSGVHIRLELEKMRKKCYHMQILHLQFLHLRIYEFNRVAFRSIFYFLLCYKFSLCM